MDAHSLTTYARGMAGALRALGPTPRDQVARMLRGLDLSEEEASTVIAFGIERGILVDHDGVIREGHG